MTLPALAQEARRTAPHTQAIVSYYDECEADYRFVWRLGRALAMHYGHWDETTSTLTAALRRQNVLLADAVAITGSERILDAGCGVGGSAIFLARHFGCRVIGITLSRRQVARARAHAQRHRVAGQVTFQVMDYERMAITAGTFDVVWALESVCYARDKAAFIREAFRVLKPGGRLALADGFAGRPRYSTAEQRVMDTWLHSWAVESLETVERFGDHLRDAGFVDVACTDVTANIIPSARRLYLHSLYALPVGRFAEAIGIRSAVQTRNIVGCRHQWTAFRDGLGRYAMFSARKG